MGERNIITKVGFDTTGVVDGSGKAKAALSSMGETAKQTAAIHEQSTAQAQRTYDRLVLSIDPVEKAQLRYSKAVEATNKLVAAGRITQEQANETLGRAKTYYDAHAASIHNLDDLFDKLGGKTALVAGEMFAVWESLKGGYEIGEKLRAGLNAVTDGGFDRFVQGAITAELAVLGFGEREDTAAEKTQNLANEINILSKHGIDTHGLSIDQVHAKYAVWIADMEQTKLHAMGLEAELQKWLSGLNVPLDTATQHLQHVVDATAGMSEAGQQKVFAQALAGDWKTLEDNLDALPNKLRAVVVQHQSAVQAAKDHEKAIAAAASAAEQLAKQIEGAATHTGLLQQALKAVQDGIDPRRVQSILAAAEKLNSTILWSPLVAELLESQDRAAQLEFRLRNGYDLSKNIAAATAEIAKNLADASHAAADFSGNLAQRSPDSDLKLPGEKEAEEFQIFIDKDLVAPWRQAWSTMENQGLDALAALASGGQVSTADLIQQWEQMWFRAFEEWLLRWIEIQAAARAASVLGGSSSNSAGTTSSAGASDDAKDAAVKAGESAALKYASAHAASAWSAAAAYMMGGSAGAAAGWAAIEVAVMAVFAHYMDTHTAKNASAFVQLGVSGQAVGDADGSGTSHNRIQAGSAAAGIAAEVNSWVQGLEASIADMALIEIKKKNQGSKTDWVVYANGVAQHFGKDMQAAMEFAAVEAIKEASLVGLSPETAAAIKGSVAMTMDDLQKDINVAIQAVADRIGGEGARLLATQQKYDQQIQAEERLGIAIDGTVAAMQREEAAQKNQLLGIDTAASDYLASLASFQAGAEELQRNEQARLDEAQRQLDQLLTSQSATGHRTFKPGDGSDVTDPSGEMSEQERALRDAVARYTADLSKIPEALSADQIHMSVFDDLYQYLQGSKQYAAEALKIEQEKVDIQFGLIKAQLEALGVWDDFAQMFNDAYAAAREQAGKPPTSGHGGGGSGAGQVTNDQRDQAIADANRNFAMRNDSDLTKSIAGVNQKWDDLTKGLNTHIQVVRKTGESQEDYNKRLKEAAEHSHKNADELARLNLARQHEIDLLLQQEKATDDQALLDYGGQSDIDQERKRADDLKKKFADLFKAGGIGAEEYARDLARINDLEQQHLHTIELQDSANLYQGLAGLIDQVGAAFGDTGEKAELLHEAAVANYELQLASLEVERAKLEAENALGPAQAAFVDGIISKLESFDPNTLFSGAPAGATTPLDPWQLGLVQTGSEIPSAGIPYTDATGNVWRWFGSDGMTGHWVWVSGPPVASGGSSGGSAGGGIEDQRASLADSLAKWLNGLTTGSASPLTTDQQLQDAKAQENALFRRIQSGDLSAYADFQSVGDTVLRLAGQDYGTSGTAYKGVFDSIEGMGKLALALVGGSTELTSPYALALQPTNQLLQQGLTASQQQVAAVIQASNDNVAALAAIKASVDSLATAQRSQAAEMSLLRNSARVRR